LFTKGERDIDRSCAKLVDQRLYRVAIHTMKPHGIKKRVWFSIALLACKRFHNSLRILKLVAAGDLQVTNTSLFCAHFAHDLRDTGRE